MTKVIHGIEMNLKSICKMIGTRTMLSVSKYNEFLAEVLNFRGGGGVMII